MTRFAAAFARARHENRPAIVAYLMAGHPDLETSFATMRAVLAEADVLEIGVPFSEPVADGPVIERAGVRALANGTRLDDVFELARRLRDAEPDKPIVLMTYFNPVYRRGLDRFAHEAARAGVDGVILPDVPLEESAEARESFEAAGLSLVQLASPATPPDRLGRLAEATRGFLYVVSSFGVTGARSDLAPETLEVVKRARAACGDKAALAVGFGVSEPRHVRMLHDAGVDGVIVGSAIVGLVDRHESPEKVAAFVRSLRI